MNGRVFELEYRYREELERRKKPIREGVTHLGQFVEHLLRQELGQATGADPAQMTAEFQHWLKTLIDEAALAPRLNEESQGLRAQQQGHRAP